MSKSGGREIWFVRKVPKSFSGQFAATEQIIDELTQKGWVCRTVDFTPFERGSTERIRGGIRTLLGVVKGWARFTHVFRLRRPIIHLSLGQSLASLIQLGLPCLLLASVRRGTEIVVSLNGSIFMTWRDEAVERRMFAGFLSRTSYVTVLGSKQQQKLIDFGVPRDRVLIVPNAPGVTMPANGDVCAKHRLNGRPDEKIRLLHLSLLIESKGFPEYLEAVHVLSKKRLPRPLDAVLCGPMAFTPYCKRFATEHDRRAWIEQKLSEINRGADACLTWIPGAQGKEKDELFRRAHVFVFPSVYPVEAQPLVLLEAMASGCAIITTDVGEIPSILDDTCAHFLEDTSPETIATAVECLMDDDEYRMSLARNASARGRREFSMDRYVGRWESIFESLSSAS